MVTVQYILLKIDKKNIKRLRIKIVGTNQFLTEFRKIVYKECNISGSLYKKGKVAELCYDGARQSIIIRDFLYNNATNNILLERKKLIAFDKQLDDLSVVSRGIPIVGINIFTKEKIYFNSKKEVFGAGFSRFSIDKCLCNKKDSYKNYIWKYNI